MSNELGTELDEEAVMALAYALNEEIRSHFLRRPRSPLTAFEALNALAYATALVAVGTTEERKARDFFDGAYAQTAKAIRAAMASLEVETAAELREKRRENGRRFRSPQLRENTMPEYTSLCHQTSRRGSL